MTNSSWFKRNTSPFSIMKTQYLSSFWHIMYNLCGSCAIGLGSSIPTFCVSYSCSSIGVSFLCECWNYLGYTSLPLIPNKFFFKEYLSSSNNQFPLWSILKIVSPSFYRVSLKETFIRFVLKQFRNFYFHISFPILNLQM